MTRRHELVDSALRLFNANQRRFVVRRARPGEPASPGQRVALELEPRRLVAELYLFGRGLEIGALDRPLDLPEGAHTRYVDRLDSAGLREQYPELEPVPVDVVDDGEHLTSVALASQDFIVANHVLEHCQDPIGTLKNLTARLKPGGILYMAVPDADQTFDARRPSTSFDHLLADHAGGTAGSRHAHYLEWVALVEGCDGDAAPVRVKQLEDLAYSIHFHVWRQSDLLELLTRAIAECDLPLRIELVMRHGNESICVLRRAGAD